MPMFANVRRIPDAMPNMSGGAAFITAELFAGKKKLAPTPAGRPQYARDRRFLSLTKGGFCATRD
jgi:hypothetical protein